MATRPRVLRTVYERLPTPVREEIARKRGELRGIGQVKINQALLAKRLADLEAGLVPAAPRSVEIADPRFPDGVRSRLCTQAQLSEPWFLTWCEALGVEPHAHRKTWEFAFVPEVLERLGMLRAGHRALGFGVGRERLVPAFAARDISVVATDLEPESREAMGWIRSDQHAFGVESMLRPEICEPEKFRRLVTWRPVDMRAIPDDLTGFDFCWSVCSLEHLGTLDAGLEFIERSLDTLRPGGIAVHTTEFNLSSDEATVEAGPTVVYRERDITALVSRLESLGHEVAALDLSRGEGLLDRYVDTPPYADEPCLRFLFASYTLTSVALVIRARGG